VGRILVGLLLGVGIAVGVAAWLRLDPRRPCLDRCADGTRCTASGIAGRCVAAAPPLPPEEKRRRRHRSDGAGLHVSAQPEVKLQPGDERMVADGDALGRPERIDFSKDGDQGHELAQEDLDRVFHAADGEISRCVGDAVGDAPLTSGRVDVALRVERSGTVSRVRITAPQLLQRRGVSRCVRPLVTRMRFPASGGASVATYPFDLN
jgi:hypothetical protein